VEWQSTTTTTTATTSTTICLTNINSFRF
jgi:hypothetical protein